MYMVYNLCENLVAGQTLWFDMGLFMAGILAAAPFVFMFSAMFMVLYLVRHPALSKVVLIVYCALYVFSWTVLIPAAVKCNISLEQKSTPVIANDRPSASYFRPAGDKVFYYTSVGTEVNEVDGLCLNTGSGAPDVYLFSKLAMLPKKTEFTDSLIQDSLDMPPVLSLSVQELGLLAVILKKCASGNLAYWLCFSTIGLALLSVIGLRYLSRWRLVNVLMVICVSSGIVLLNLLGYTNTTVVAMEHSVNDVLGNVGLLKKISGVGNIFVMFSNIIIFVILTVAGILLDRHYVAQIEAEAGDEL